MRAPHTTRARGVVERVRGAANPHIDLLVRAGDGKRRVARPRGSAATTAAICGEAIAARIWRMAARRATRSVAVA
jgi:hypothetical protein